MLILVSSVINLYMQLLKISLKIAENDRLTSKLNFVFLPKDAIYADH